MIGTKFCRKCGRFYDRYNCEAARGWRLSEGFCPCCHGTLEVSGVVFIGLGVWFGLFFALMMADGAAIVTSGGLILLGVVRLVRQWRIKRRMEWLEDRKMGDRKIRLKR